MDGMVNLGAVSAGLGVSVDVCCVGGLRRTLRLSVGMACVVQVMWVMCVCEFGCRRCWWDKHACVCQLSVCR